MRNAYKAPGDVQGYNPISKSNIPSSAPGGGGDVKPRDRNYDKPWLQPQKEKKKAETYAEHVYPDGIGPDTDLINMIERDVLLKNPNVQFDDIADLDETKKLL